MRRTIENSRKQPKLKAENAPPKFFVPVDDDLRHNLYNEVDCSCSDIWNSWFFNDTVATTRADLHT